MESHKLFKDAISCQTSKADSFSLFLGGLLIYSVLEVIAFTLGSFHCSSFLFHFLGHSSKRSNGRPGSHDQPRFEICVQLCLKGKLLWRERRNQVFKRDWQEWKTILHLQRMRGTACPRINLCVMVLIVHSRASSTAEDTREHRAATLGNWLASSKT